MFAGVQVNQTGHASRNSFLNWGFQPFLPWGGKPSLTSTGGRVFTASQNMPVNHLKFTFTGSHTCDWIFPKKRCWPEQGILPRQKLDCQGGQRLLVPAADPGTAHSCCAAAWCQSTFILRGKERRLSLPVPLDPSFTSAHFHHPIISHIQREIFAQIIQRRKSWSKFVKYFLILVGKALQKSWCTTQMDFRVVLSKLTWLDIFPCAYFCIYCTYSSSCI